MPIPLTKYLTKADFAKMVARKWPNLVDEAGELKNTARFRPVWSSDPQLPANVVLYGFQVVREANKRGQLWTQLHASEVPITPVNLAPSSPAAVVDGVWTAVAVAAVFWLLTGRR